MTIHHCKLSRSIRPPYPSTLLTRPLSVNEIFNPDRVDPTFNRDARAGGSADPHRLLSGLGIVERNQAFIVSIPPGNANHPNTTRYNIPATLTHLISAAFVPLRFFPSFPKLLASFADGANSN